MATSILEGAVATNQPTDMYNYRRKFDIDDVIAELVPSETPFITFLMKQSKEVVGDPDVRYWEHRLHYLDGQTFYVSDTCCLDGVAWGTGCTSCLQYQKTDGANDAVSFLTGGEIVEIIDADDVSKTVRLLLTSAAPGTLSCSIKVVGGNANNINWDPAAGDEILVVGKAFEEGSSKTSGYIDNLEMYWASTQIFKTHYKITNTQKQTRTWAGNEYDRIRADKAIEHKFNINRTLLFGNRYSGTAGNPFAAPGSGDLLGSTFPMRTSHGVFPSIDYSSTQQSYAGSRAFKKAKSTYTFQQWMDDMEEKFEFGSTKKFTFCGMGYITFFNKMALDESMMTISPGENMLGIDVQTLISPAGREVLVHDPILRGTYHKNWGATLDMNNVSLIVLNGRDTSLELHVETPGDDVQEDQYLTECGLKIKLLETHSITRLY